MDLPPKQISPRRLVSKGFTLVELMVVVTVLVVLIAMLVPAMDKAMYQAELAVCGAVHRSAMGGATQYAVDQRRWYPYRKTRSAANIQSHYISFGAKGGAGDDRPVFKPYIQINGMLQCPLSQEVDLENGAGGVRANFHLWFGWGYSGGETGMHRLGDRWTYSDPNGSQPVHRFSLLTSPLNSFTRVDPVSPASSHPDDDRRMVNVVGATVSFWWADMSHDRGLVDLNFGYDDGSVRRLDHVQLRDPRCMPIPLAQNKSDPVAWQIWVPKE